MRLCRFPGPMVVAALALVLGACASVDPAPAPAPAPEPVPAPAASPAAVPIAPDASPTDGTRYACDTGITVSARFGDGAVTVSGLPAGEEVLLRDAGGVTPEQTVWSNERLRAEFGLPPGGEGAELQVLQPSPATLHCRRVVIQ